MREKKVVIFDLDGTLLDTLADLGDSVNRTLALFGFETHSYEAIKGMIGNGARRLAYNAMPKGIDPETAERCAAHFVSNYQDGRNEKTRPYRGIVEILDILHEHGIMTAVVTNKPDPAAKAICESFFGSRLDLVMGDRPDMPRKPDPCGVFHVMETLGCSRAVFIGDGDTDIEVAKNAGIGSVAVSWGFRDREFLREKGAEVIVDDAESLLYEIGRSLGEELGEIEIAEDEK